MIFEILKVITGGVPVKKSLLSLFVALVFLSGCMGSKKTVSTSTFTYSPEKHAVLVGEFKYVAESFFGDSIKNASVLARRIPFNDDGSEPHVENLNVLTNRDYDEERRIGGGMTAYYVTPGKYLVLPSNVRLDGERYDMVDPAKKNRFEGFFTAVFHKDFWSSPAQWTRDHSRHFTKGSLGELTVRPGDVVYFGDILYSDPGIGRKLFVVKNDMAGAREFMAKINPALVDQLEFRSWEGTHFYYSEAVKPTEGGEANATAVEAENANATMAEESI